MPAVSGLRLPLAALRASLESLSHRFDERDPRAPQAAAALAQVTRLQHNVQTILDAQHPTQLRLLSCTLHEIVSSAVNALVPEHRSRVLAAVERGDERVLVDGPLVSRALTRILEIGLDQGSDSALLRVHARDGRATFSVLLERLEASSGSIEALALHVAQRDVERMGGQVHERMRSERCPRSFDIEFAVAGAGEEAA